MFHDEKLKPFVTYLAPLEGTKDSAKVVAEPLTDWFYRDTGRGKSLIQDKDLPVSDGKLSEIPQVRFYLSRPFTRLRSVFVALRAFRDRQKIKLHA